MLNFILSAIKNWDQTASVIPSSKYLADRMTSDNDFASAKVIVELGPGSGIVTKAILRKIPKDAKLFIVEINKTLLAETVSKLNDPRLIPIYGSAEDLSIYGIPKADIIVSGLGLSLMPNSLRNRVISSSRDLLKPNGKYIQFGYINTSYISFSLRNGFSRFRYDKFLRQYFSRIVKNRVFANVPPANVFVCQG